MRSLFCLLCLCGVAYSAAALPGFYVSSPYEGVPLELVSVIDPVTGEGLLLWPLNENNTNCMLYNRTTEECLSQKLENATHLLTMPNLNWVCRDLSVNRQRPSTQLLRLDFPEAKKDPVTLSRNFRDDSLCPHRQAEQQRDALKMRYYWQARGAAEAQTQRFWGPTLSALLICYVFTTLLAIQQLRTRMRHHPERYDWWQNASVLQQVWAHCTWNDHDFVPQKNSSVEDTELEETKGSGD